MFVLPSTHHERTGSPMRALPTVIASAALLGMTALPAFAAQAGHPAVHNFSVPGVPGVSAWGSYVKTGDKVSVTLCVKDTSAKVSLAFVIGVAMNKNFTHHQNITAEALGDGKQTCRSVTTTDTTRLTVLASSVGHDGSSLVGKLRKIY
jgi:hypothetical protein